MEYSQTKEKKYRREIRKIYVIVAEIIVSNWARKFGQLSPGSPDKGEPGFISPTVQRMFVQFNF